MFPLFPLFPVVPTLFPLHMYARAGGGIENLSGNREHWEQSLRRRSGTQAWHFVKDKLSRGPASGRAAKLSSFFVRLVQTGQCPAPIPVRAHNVMERVDVRQVT
jgi:hypothetical protein